MRSETETPEPSSDKKGKRKRVVVALMIISAIFAVGIVTLLSINHGAKTLPNHSAVTTGNISASSITTTPPQSFQQNSATSSTIPASNASQSQSTTVASTTAHSQPTATTAMSTNNQVGNSALTNCGLNCVSPTTTSTTSLSVSTKPCQYCSMPSSSYADGTGFIFTHIVSSNNVNATDMRINNLLIPSGTATSLDNSNTNNNPAAFLEVSLNWSANQNYIYFNSPLGLFYDQFSNNWWVYTLNQTTLPINLSINVLESSSSLGVLASQSNAPASSNMACTKNLYQPNQLALITFVENPNNDVGATASGYPFLIQPTEVGPLCVGVTDGKINAGASFFLYLGPSQNSGLTLTSTNNTNSDYVPFNSSTPNSTSITAVAFATPMGTYQESMTPSSVGVFYENGSWAAFNEDKTSLYSSSIVTFAKAS